MINLIQRFYWNSVMMRAAIDAISQRRPISNSLTPPQGLSYEEQDQWKEEALSNLTEKAARSVRAAKKLIALERTPNAAIMVKVADTCHYTGWCENHWNSTGIRKAGKTKVGLALRATALIGFEVALEIDANEKGALYGKGEIAFIEQRFDEANTCFKKLLALGVDDVSEKGVEFYISVCEGDHNRFFDNDEFFSLDRALDRMNMDEIGALNSRVVNRLLSMT